MRKTTTPEDQLLKASPALLCIKQDSPVRLPRKLLYLLLILFAIAMIWLMFGTINIVTTASGKIVLQDFQDAPVQAEVWVANADAGFVTPNQKARIKIDAYPFQKYGMVEGLVKQVSADSSEAGQQSASTKNQPITSPLYYRVLVALDNAHLERDGTRHLLMPGMQVNAEIHLGTRSVMDYLLSPIQKVVHEAGRER